MLPPGQPQEGNLVTAGCLQFPARAHVAHESVQPHAQQSPGMIGRRPKVVSIYLDAKFSPLFPMERIDEFGHESRGMILGNQFAESRRQ